jgi:hypothetical protein
VILNISTHHHKDYTIQLEGKLSWKEIFNSNHLDFWGNGSHTNENIRIKLIDQNNSLCEIKIDIPALSSLMFQ